MSATATAAVSKAGAVKKDSVPEIIAASMVGTAIEFYDNYCYSIAAASYFGTIFFPAASKANPALGTMYAFLTFAVSFLARPLVVPEKLRTLDHGRPWSDDQFASTRLSSNRDMSR